jgi:hypothetical protein
LETNRARDSCLPNISEFWPASPAGLPLDLRQEKRAHSYSLRKNKLPARGQLTTPPDTITTRRSRLWSEDENHMPHKVNLIWKYRWTVPYPTLAPTVPTMHQETPKWPGRPPCWVAQVLSIDARVFLVDTLYSCTQLSCNGSNQQSHLLARPFSLRSQFCGLIWIWQPPRSIRIQCEGT